MKSIYYIFSLFIAIVYFLELSEALECYVCDRQEGNVEKCLNTIQTCEQGYDVCLSEIEWGSTPYWSQGAIKQYYVSKRCSTKEKCQKTRKNNMPLCTHIWYYDWKCSECCLGDRCNYYIISGSNYIHMAKTTVLSVIISMALLHCLHRVLSL